MVEFASVEVGTSDFNFASVPEGSRVLYVEPVSEYLENARKIAEANGLDVETDCCAIIPHDMKERPETVKIFFIDPEVHDKYEMPLWVRGCNHVGSVHPEVKIYLEQNKLPADLVSEREVPVKTIAELYRDHNVSRANILKYDTEGMDTFLVISAAQTLTKEQRPEILKFESNYLNLRDKVALAIRTWRDLGYTLMTSGADTIMRRIHFADIGSKAS